MLSKNQIKEITALHQKKFRNEMHQFIAEGEKVVTELLKSGWNVKAIYGTPDFFKRFSGKLIISKKTDVVLITDTELKKISALSTPHHVLAVAEMNEHDSINYSGGLKIVLDGISDPGNLGTIIRTADWFGIDEIICSNETADCYNPKVVQATMGSLFRVKIIYADLGEVFKVNAAKSKLRVYGTVLDGKDLFDMKLAREGFILSGNESRGISSEFMRFITDKVTIPHHAKTGAESLNVGISTAIVCSEFRRQGR